MNDVNFSFPDPGQFAYDPERPTFYTERLSWALHVHHYNLSQAGAKISVETATHEEQVTALAAYGSSVESWSASAISALTDFLTGAEDATSPTFQSFPPLPALIEGAVSLIPGGKIGLLVKGLMPFVRGWFVLQEKLRPTDPVRILDMALLKSSWFLPGLRSSWLEEISDKLDAIASKESGINFDSLLPYLEAEVVAGSGEKKKLGEILLKLVESLTTQDCSANPLSIADLLSMALGACVPSGVEGVSVYRGVFDALEDLRVALASSDPQFEVDTDSAGRVVCIRFGGGLVTLSSKE